MGDSKRKKGKDGPEGVVKRKLSLRVGSETVTFNIRKSMKSKHSRDDYLYCTDHTAKIVQEQWVDTVDHDGKWTEVEEEEDSNKVQAVSFYPRTEPMLECLAGHEYYCFPNRFSRYFQIPIALEDQEKTTFTCPYGTFAYKQMPFEFCNTPATFQRCMTAIFHELIEESMEVVLDDFFVFCNSFDHCLKNLEKMLKRCKETKLVLNWEKCHFMVKVRIVLGLKVLGAGIEAPIMIKPDWSLPFEVMCDASDYAVRAVLGQRIDKHFKPIH
nr:retrovirus-related Pol polyprotein from transposon 17.6 [Tanacetum cinerariifolium]